MHRLIFSLFGLLAAIGAFAQAPADSLVRAKVVVEGLLFDKSVATRDLCPGGSSISMLKDPEGKMVFAVYLPKGYELEDAIVEKALEPESVMYASQLLRDYEGRRPVSVAEYQGIGVEVGKPFLDFDYVDTDNRRWNNAALRGKVYVVNVWQKECGPCRREMPELSKWKEEMPEVVFLSASRHNTEEILPIAEQHSFTWIHLQEATDIVAIARQEGFPVTVVVDAEGIVRYAKVGASAEHQAAAHAAILSLLR